MIGLLIRETILLRKTYACTHDWRVTPECKDTEEQCVKCTIVATPEGKINLKRAADTFYGRRPS